MGSSVSVFLGLTWGGVFYAWSSPQVLAPLIIGLAGIVGFVVYEATLSPSPMVPWKILSNRTTVSGYVIDTCTRVLITSLILANSFRYTGTAFHGLIVSTVLCKTSCYLAIFYFL